MNNTIKEKIAPLIISIGKKIEKKYFSDTPIVIGACPRSGTTIAQAILDAHPEIFAIPRQTYAFDRWEEIEINGNSNYKPTRLDRLYREFIKRKIPESSRRWCEKTPKHIKSFDKILSHFENQVKLINIVRDGRDVVTSNHPKHSPNDYWVDIDRWVEDVTIGLSLKNHPCVLTIKYENLINNFEEELKRICSFIEIEMSPQMINFTKFTNIKRSKHLDAPVTQLYSKSIGRWKLQKHADRIKEFMTNKSAVNLLHELNYDV